MTDNALEIIQEQPLVAEMAQAAKLQPFVYLQTMQRVAMPQGQKWSAGELMSCLMVAAEHKLNPLTKEIYFMKTKSGAIQPLIGVDGWITICNRHPQFDGLEFEDHRDNGQVYAISCKIYRKDRKHPIEATEYLEECKGDTQPWRKWPLRMLRHRALTQAARLAFGLAGVMDRDEYDQWQAKDITPHAVDLPDPEIDQTPLPDPEEENVKVIDDVVPDELPNPSEDDFPGDAVDPHEEELFIEAVREDIASAAGDREIIGEIIEHNAASVRGLSPAGRKIVAEIYQAAQA